MIAILKYGLGNILSIGNMLLKAGHECTIAESELQVGEATKIILPGVGHFDFGMKMIRASSFFNTLERKILDDRIPVLGICLGAQMMLEGSEEGSEKGLGWIKGKCVRFDPSLMSESLTIPNMGWADVSFKKPTGLNREIHESPRYYFVHSFHMVCDHSADVLATSEYGYIFTSAFNHNNIYGVQFHPEKSHKFGMAILKNFAEL